MYKISAPDYNRLLSDNVTSAYRKSSSDVVNKINAEAKAIAETANLDDRIQSFPQKEAFITLKDYKPNFVCNPKCRLINPAKSEIGKISKSYLDEINNAVRNKSKLPQWRSTKSVIDWFKSLENKPKYRFIKFDIVDFYPSITQELLSNAICFAKSSLRSTTA